MLPSLEKMSSFEEALQHSLIILTPTLDLIPINIAAVSHRYWIRDKGMWHHLCQVNVLLVL